MSKNILPIQGHPDASTSHLCRALGASYVAGAEESGHVVRQINVAELEFPLLCSQKDWEKDIVPASLKPARVLMPSSTAFCQFRRAPQACAATR